MKKVLLLTLTLALLSALGSAGAPNPAGIKGIRYSTYSSHTRVVIDLTAQAEFKGVSLKESKRVYFDLSNCVLSNGVNKHIEIYDGTIRKVRAGQFSEEAARITIDFEGDSAYSVFPLEKPDRLVIDVYKPAAASPPVKAKETPKKDAAKEELPLTIVIDPGHGGKDPGAMGKNGLKEKDVVLSVALKLGEILKKRHGAKIIYTRQNDIFIPLDERTEKANANKADLFISVHANASEKHSARGIETYLLNWADDNEAIRVAARENNISTNKMMLLRGGLQMILDDLSRSHKKEESMRLARAVQDSMVSKLKEGYSNVNDLGVKQALFYVLIGAEMPSVLVEISFISNPEEEMLLSNRRYKDKIAEGIAGGVGVYAKKSAVVARK
ncbi:MAG: N-acetylmuramoyl-L-alanine amidase [Nitrospirae bacterium]|nr:N-acetylmuramoyl-L-alanine amidase [Nitrospirota bacterium]